MKTFKEIFKKKEIKNLSAITGGKSGPIDRSKVKRHKQG